MTVLALFNMYKPYHYGIDYQRYELSRGKFGRLSRDDSGLGEVKELGTPNIITSTHHIYYRD